MELTLQQAESNARRNPATRRERYAWYLYDWGNSAYAAVVPLAIYSAYFKGTVVGGAEGSRLWGLAVGIAMLVLGVLSPILGALADFSAVKKRTLFIFTSVACVFTAMLFFIQKGDIFTGMLFFILAEIGYRGGQVFYNALLPEITTEDKMGEVSGKGWAVGSLGGVICLGIVLAMILTTKGALVVRVSFLITAGFFIIAAIPAFLYIKERARPQVLRKGETFLAMPFRRLWSTFKEARKYKEFFRFIISYLFFNAGIMITFDFAAIIGAVLFGMNQQQLIILVIIGQVTSIFGAFGFGMFAQRWGSKLALVISLVLMIIVVFGLFIVDSLNFFFAIGALAGFALTGVQSVSRTMVGQMAPDGKSAEFYGLFAVFGFIASFVGNTLFGFMVLEGTHWYLNNRGLAELAAEQMGTRMAVSSIVAFLSVGLVLLMFVRQKRHMAVLEAEHQKNAEN
jgi:UMF1 family MFS transporter